MYNDRRTRYSSMKCEHDKRKVSSLKYHRFTNTPSEMCCKCLFLLLFVHHSKLCFNVVFCFFIFRLISLHEMGMLAHLKRKFFKNTDLCGADLRTDSSPLDISHVWTAFVMLGIGLTTSIACLVVEVLRTWFKLRVLSRTPQT